MPPPPLCIGGLLLYSNNKISRYCDFFDVFHFVISYYKEGGRKFKRSFEYKLPYACGGGGHNFKLIRDSIVPEQRCVYAF